MFECIGNSSGFIFMVTWTGTTEWLNMHNSLHNFTGWCLLLQHERSEKYAPWNQSCCFVKAVYSHFVQRFFKDLLWSFLECLKDHCIVLSWRYTMQEVSLKCFVCSNYLYIYCTYIDYERHLDSNWLEAVVEQVNNFSFWTPKPIHVFWSKIIVTSIASILRVSIKLYLKVLFSYMF